MKYIVVGGVAFLVDYGTFFLALHVLGWAVLVSNTISFCLGLITSFLAQRYWTFAHKEKTYSSHIRRQFYGYFVLALCNLVLSSIFIEVLVHSHVPALVAKFISVVMIAVWNFFILRQKVFAVDQ